MEEKVSLKLPELFVKRMQEQLGDEYQAYLDALDSAPPAAIRLNPARTRTFPSPEGDLRAFSPSEGERQKAKGESESQIFPSPEGDLRAFSPSEGKRQKAKGESESQIFPSPEGDLRAFSPSEGKRQKAKGESESPILLTPAPVPWCKTGLILPERPVYTLDPWFQGGAYYVQEPSSMFLEQAFLAADLPDNAVVLDLCAAPGGKTTHLLSLISDKRKDKGERRKDKVERRQEKVDLRRERRDYLKAESEGSRTQEPDSGAGLSQVRTEPDFPKSGREPESPDSGRDSDFSKPGSSQTFPSPEGAEFSRIPTETRSRTFPSPETEGESGMLDFTGLLVSNEIIRSRAAILRENVEKWGYPNVIVTNGDPADFGKLGEVFDMIVADVPCSGEGLFRKESGAIGEWSPENTALCAARQRRIVAEAWKCLKPGGYLIYSTCTFNPEENEVNLNWLRNETQCEPITIPFRLKEAESSSGTDQLTNQLKKEAASEPNDSPNRLNRMNQADYEPNDSSNRLMEEVKSEPVIPPMEKYWGVREISYQGIIGYQLMPHRLHGEGFFLSIVRKPGELQSSHPWKASPRGWSTVKKQVSAELSQWLLSGTQATFLEKEGEFSYIHPDHLPFLSYLERHVRVLQAGTAVATGDGNLLNPHPAFAMSLLCNNERFPIVDLELDDAIRYLQRESPNLPDAPKGWLRVGYRGIALGWVKNLGNRCNNYFPKERRIRMSVDQRPALWHE